ncbi:MAG: 30S ribosomal protein S15 [Cytophagales bacterium]|nr:30S ribosomal protein S15 [Cytophagales bacterium]
MKLTNEEKKNSYEKQKSKQNTGSPESQITLFTHRISHLTAHLKKHRKDNASRRGLVKLVGKRKRLLAYLEGESFDRYKKIIGDLGLRK